MRLLATADGHEDFWPAYSDILMVTCLVMVLLAATFALLRQDDRVAEELRRRKQAFVERFDAHMAEARRRGHVTLASPVGERQVISFSDTLLFRQGDAELTQPLGLATLARLAQRCGRQAQIFGAGQNPVIGLQKIIHQRRQKHRIARQMRQIPRRGTRGRQEPAQLFWLRQQPTQSLQGKRFSGVLPSHGVFPRVFHMFS